MKVKLVVTGSQGYTPYYRSGNWASDLVGLRSEICKNFWDFNEVYKWFQSHPSEEVTTSGHHYVGDGVQCKLGFVLPNALFKWEKGKFLVDDAIAESITSLIAQGIKESLGMDAEVELFCPNIK